MNYLNSAVAYPGSRVEVKAVFAGKCIYQATLFQPGEPDVKSEISTSVLGAMENLQKWLKQDYEKQGQ